MCTSTGAAFDLNQFRAKYMRGHAASARFLPVRVALQLMFTLHATSTRFLLSSCGRGFSQSTFAQSGALLSRPTWGNTSTCSGQLSLTRRPRQVRWCKHPAGQSSQLRSKEQASRTTLPTGTALGTLATAHTWGAWSVMPNCMSQTRALMSQQDSLQTALLSPSQAIPELKTTMQRGTPIGRERHYSWRADERRSEASSLSPMARPRKGEY